MPARALIVDGVELADELGDLVNEISVDGSDRDLSGLAQAIEKQISGKIAKSIERRMRDKGFYKRSVDGR